jgi:hypothetical protein
VGVWSGFSWLMIGTGVVGCCKYGEEPLGFGTTDLVS